MKFNNVEEIVSFVAEQKKLPEWQRELFSQYREEVRVHSRGELFYKIDRLFPNEHPMSKEHRVLSFESITKGSFWKGVNNVVRIFQNSSYSLQASKNTGEHITEHNFKGQDFFSYFLEMWCNKALADDPNGRIVVYPIDFVDSKPFPQVLFIPSELIEYIDEETIVFISEEESEKKYEVDSGRSFNTVYDNNIDAPNIVLSKKNTFLKKVNVTWVKKVYHVFTDDGFYRINQVENSDEFEFEFWKHANVFFPVIAAGGMDAGKGIFQSFFSVFCPFGNLALLQHSQHTAVNFIFSFPRMDEVQVDCDAKGCQGGQVIVDVTEENPLGRKACTVCKGLGKVTPQSPYKIYTRKLNLSPVDDGDAKNVNYDSVKYYTPDTAILNYSKQEWKDYLDFAEQALYVRQRIQTGNVESAKSKEIDVDEKYDFVSPIRKGFFHCMMYCVQMMENYLNNSPVKVTIDVPQGVAIETELEALDTLQLIIKSDIQTFVKAAKVETFINKFVSSSSYVRRMFSILKKVDLLLFYTDAQIASQKMGGVVTSSQWATHIYAYPILQRMFTSDPKLFEQEDKVIIDQLNTILADYLPNEEMLKQTLINQFSQ